MANTTASKGRRDDSKGMREVQKEFQEELLGVDRVTRVTAGGRQLRFRASVIIGDGKGRVGLGLGKAGEVVVAIEKAVRDAKKNLITFPIVEGTIPHDLTANFKAASIMIHPASRGTGIIAGGSARKIFAVSGIKDILAKQRGGNNPITNARVTLKALSCIKPVVKFASKKVATEATTEVVAPAATEEVKVAKKAPARKPAAKKDAE